MKLLIITQVVDKNHPVLGFFCGWVEEFSKHCEKVIVIGQQCGEYTFPNNVKIISLKKELGRLKILQVLTFYRIIWQQRKEYDSVFVHMIPLWVVLGALPWKVLGKKIYLWYAAKGGGILLKIAEKFTQGIFTSTPDGLPIVSSKKIVVSQGINTQLFSYNSQNKRDPNLLISVGRIGKAKRLEVLINTMIILPINYHLHLIGIPITEEEKKYQEYICKYINHCSLNDRVQIYALPQAELPEILSRAHMFIHASTTTLDKAVLEAMACECPVVSCCEVVQQVLPNESKSTMQNFSQIIKDRLCLSEAEYKKWQKVSRNTVVNEHSIEQLIQKIVRNIKV